MVGLTDAARIDRLAAIRQRLSAAAAGTLFEEDESGPPLKPVRRDPSLWEIRWDLAGQPWRLYHAKPALAPGYLVALRFPEKDLAGGDTRVRAAQNEHIDCAAHRYNTGRRTLWGLP